MTVSGAVVLGSNEMVNSATFLRDMADATRRR
eukprot:COSAG04_NODE_14423_length_568_cov_2.492537_2_plen_31_part_01